MFPSSGQRLTSFFFLVNGLIPFFLCKFSSSEPNCGCFFNGGASFNQRVNPKKGQCVTGYPSQCQFITDRRSAGKSASRIRWRRELDKRLTGHCGDALTDQRRILVRRVCAQLAISLPSGEDSPISPPNFHTIKSQAENLYF